MNAGTFDGGHFTDVLRGVDVSQPRRRPLGRTTGYGPRTGRAGAAQGLAGLLVDVGHEIVPREEAQRAVRVSDELRIGPGGGGVVVGDASARETVEALRPGSGVPA